MPGRTLQYKRAFETDRSVALYGRSVDVHRLRVLRAVVAEGSIHRAAGNLGYTPSAISQHLTTLQRETGLALVQRSGRGIEPTAAGLAVAAASGAVFEQLAQVESLVADLRAGRVGALSVRYFASAGTAWIPGVVAALTVEFPELRLDLRLLELAATGSTPPDVEIAVDGATPVPPGHTAYPLVVEPYFAVVPRTSPLAGRAHVRLGELREQSWVDNDVTRGPCRRAVLDACSSIGFSPAFRVETQDYPSAIRFVGEGVGITVVPQLGLVDLPSSVVAVPITDPTPRRSISVHVRDALADHPAVLRILELLDDRVRPSH